MTGLDRIVAFLNTLDERTFRRHGENHVVTDMLTSPQALAAWLATTAGDAHFSEPTDEQAAEPTRAANANTQPAEPSRAANANTQPAEPSHAANPNTQRTEPTRAASAHAADQAGPAMREAAPGAVVARDGHADQPVELDVDDLAATVELRTALRKVLDGDTSALVGYPVRLARGHEDGELRLTAATGRPWLDDIVETVAAGVARGDWKRVKLCAAPDCRWAFHDTSRNGRGRWCEMGVCGNRHKTRAYRERRQQHDR
ncbi:CGNR zinc finger domain-containing protein [Paractinoplanes abujensis]|uniref:Putative RNA-binding Zn ribbon-like protein n=1 Tax=Paractinoplanes abujensis TaxID=882441 RepID=A0A7W7FZI0_9ACTN|nr:CGNR zinc finger domain-containing protein [Actinoplanes abujensis]MBB4692093.1 putative RNA-binding Zn ribbon-like protein [Actinoplanes abujensis]